MLTDYRYSCYVTVCAVIWLCGLDTACGTLYTNRWVVRAGDEADLRAVCDDHFFTYIGPLFDDYYTIQHNDVPNGMPGPAHAMQDLLDADPKVSWAKQLIHKQRLLRDATQSTQDIEADDAGEDDEVVQLQYTDPEHEEQQWYMYQKSDEAPYPGLNVDVAWRKGYTGKGVVVAVVDEGLFPNNPDLADNYYADASFSFTYNSTNPSPDGRESHGTRCAGVIAATGNNSYCGVGVANQASIAGIAIPFDTRLADDIEAQALSYALDEVDVYSNSWGPPDMNQVLGDAGPLLTRALQLGVTKGRRGKGAIYVWASGNGGAFGNSCAYDGYVNLRYTIPVAGVRSSGERLNTGESCSAVMVAAYSRSRKTDPPIITSDGDASDGSCVKTFRLSSAAAPMVSGAVALALQANPYLTWRDVQHLLVRSSNSSVTLNPNDWIINGAGLKVSPTFGFGILDVAQLVDMAERWLMIPQSITCVHRGHQVVHLPEQLDFFMTDCPIVYLEHVQVTFNLTFTARGHVGLTMFSPAGTESQLLPGRYTDTFNNTLNWTVVSVHYWGEPVTNPSLPWTLNFTRQFPTFNTSGELLGWEVTFHGMELQPPFLKPKCVAPLQCKATGACSKDPVRWWMLWGVAFAVGYMCALCCCCVCLHYGYMRCRRYYRRVKQRRANSRLQRTIADGWQSETDEETGVTRPPSSVSDIHLPSSTHQSGAMKWTPDGLRDAFTNVIKPFVWQFICCCLKPSKPKPHRQTSMCPSALMLETGTAPSGGDATDGGAGDDVDGGPRSAEVPTYEAPVPAVCTQQFPQPTQIYNLNKCTVQVIGKPAAVQVFNLNKSVIAFIQSDKNNDEQKGIVEMCNECIVVNGQPQMNRTHSINICKNKASRGEACENNNQTIKILQSSLHITINSDHYGAERSQIINVYDSVVCIEVKAGCDETSDSNRTVNIIDSRVEVALPGQGENGRRSVVHGSSARNAMANEAIEYATVCKDPKLQKSSTTYTQNLAANPSNGQNGGYTALNRAPPECEIADSDYCVPGTSGTAHGQQAQATVHSDHTAEVPLAQVLPYTGMSPPPPPPVPPHTGDSHQQQKQPIKVTVPEVPNTYTVPEVQNTYTVPDTQNTYTVPGNTEATDVKEPWSADDNGDSRSNVYTVPQLPTQNQGQSTRPAANPTGNNTNFNPYSCLIGPVAVPSSTYTVPESAADGARPRSQGEYPTNSRIYTGLTDRGDSPPQASPPYVIPNRQRSPPSTYAIPTNVNRPHSSDASNYTVPAQLPSSFRPIEKPEVAPKPVEIPKIDPFSKKVHTEIDPISKEPLYAVPNTMQKPFIMEIPPFKPKAVESKPAAEDHPVQNGAGASDSRQSRTPSESLPPKRGDPPPRPPRLTSLEDPADAKKAKNTVPTLKPRNRPLSVEIRCNNPKKKKNPRPVSVPDDESLEDDVFPGRTPSPEEPLRPAAPVKVAESKQTREPENGRIASGITGAIQIDTAVDDNGNTAAVGLPISAGHNVQTVQS